MRDSRRRFARLCLALLIFGAASWGQNNNRTEFVNGREAAEREVLVKFRPTTSLAVFQAQVAADVDEVGYVGSAQVMRFHSRSKNAPALISELSARADVEYAEPNYIVHSTVTPNDPYFVSLWGMPKIGAPSAWDVFTGSDANVVAVVDTGIDYTHPDLSANVWSAPSAFNVNIGGRIITCPAGSHGFNAIANTCDPMDDNSHGTHVFGTIGAVGNNGGGVAGVNWTASIMGAKFLDKNGSGTTANAINAIEFVIQAKAAFAGVGGANVRVLSNSWGGGGSSQSLLNEINRANLSDMLFVAAAGNTGSNNDLTPFYPANYSAPNVIAVAATDSNDALASFSNYGHTTVDLGAPGVNILSTVAGGGYAYYSGTSMATPHVSGAAILILSQCALDTAALKANLLGNVDIISSLTGKTVTDGRLNVNKAIRACGATAADFTLSASPSSLTVVQGANASATIDIARSGGFNGAVSFTAAGLPGGATATFNPTSTTGSSSTLTVTTTANAQVGSSLVTITGTSGSLTHITTVNLTVNASPQTGDFSISVTPSSRTITRGGETTYTVTITASDGFAGDVSLSASGLPSRSSATFNPVSVKGSGTSTLTVSTNTKSPKRTFTLTIGGTSGSLAHSTTVLLTLR